MQTAVKTPKAKFEVTPLMVFKDLAELPPSMKHLEGRIPQSKQLVKVLEVVNTRFIKVKFSIGVNHNITHTLLIEHFRTPAKHKLREKLLKMPRNPRIEKAIKNL
jgi:hypothetical protein